MYGIKMLCEKANISQQTFYRLSNKDPGFRELVAKNKVKKGNGYRYTEDVLQWLLDYKGEDPTETQEETKNISSDQREKEELLKRIAELEAENKALSVQLEEKEKERKELVSQNGMALMLLSQEKAEKQLLLPAPKVPLAQRVRQIFTEKKERT